MANGIAEQLVVRVAATTENTAEVNAAAVPDVLSTTVHSTNKTSSLYCFISCFDKVIWSTTSMDTACMVAKRSGAFTWESHHHDDNV